MSAYPYRYLIGEEEVWISSTAPIHAGDYVLAFMKEEGRAKSWKVKSIQHIRDVQGGDTELMGARPDSS